jgi:hypothetical protein
MQFLAVLWRKIKWGTGMMTKLSVLLLCFVAVVSTAVSVQASGTGPGDEDPVASWDYCMQEEIKADVWAGNMTAENAVSAAYRACRQDFKAALASFSTAKEKAALKQRAESDFKMHVDFAVKMKKLGNPNK